MHRYLDRTTAQIDPVCRFVLHAMRLWLSAAEQGMCPPRMLRPLFAEAGMMRALPRFHLAMALIARDALRGYRFAPPGCRLVHDDEALLLTLFSAEDKAAAASLVVKDHAAEMLARAVTDFGCALAVSDITVDLAMPFPDDTEPQ
jgi:hypothetical protein